MGLPYFSKRVWVRIGGFGFSVQGLSWKEFEAWFGLSVVENLRGPLACQMVSYHCFP